MPSTSSNEDEVAVGSLPVGYLAQLTDKPVRKKKNPIGFCAPPKEK